MLSCIGVAGGATQIQLSYPSYPKDLLLFRVFFIFKEVFNGRAKEILLAEAEKGFL